MLNKDVKSIDVLSFQQDGFHVTKIRAHTRPIFCFLIAKSITQHFTCHPTRNDWNVVVILFINLNILPFMSFPPAMCQMSQGYITKVGFAYYENDLRANICCWSHQGEIKSLQEIFYQDICLVVILKNTSLSPVDNSHQVAEVCLEAHSVLFCADSSTITLLISFDPFQFFNKNIFVHKHSFLSTTHCHTFLSLQEH